MTTKIIISISNLPVNLVFHIGANPVRKTFHPLKNTSQTAKEPYFKRQIQDMKIRRRI
jgi:hypothetical protein